MKKSIVIGLSVCVIMVLSSTVHAMSKSIPPKNSSNMTKYPIVLVPGVFAWGELFGVYDHFYGIESALERHFGSTEEARKKVHYIQLNPWQSTKDRGKDLADEINRICKLTNSPKVNVIAHSHGAVTTRVAMAQSNQIASLTSIAGPHFGTPSADGMVDMPDWMFKLTCKTLNLASDVVDIFSTGRDFLSKSDSKAVFNGFTVDQMEDFNNKYYPSAGISPQGTCAKYGADSANDRSYWGNGLGDSRSGDESDAIRFYSSTGDIGKRSFAFGSVDIPGDIVTIVTRYFANDYGFRGDADGFIPVSSAKFGQFLGDYNWNHCDEINQVMGLKSIFAAEPKNVYIQHASRLKNHGF